MRLGSPHALLLLLVGLLAAACEQEAVDWETRQPLRPLIYTELPQLTPQGAQVREERLMRRLVEGLSEEEMEEASGARRAKLPAPTSARSFGRLIFHALITQDAFLWEHCFVSPESYAALVHMKLPEAKEFVDNTLGATLPVWAMFQVTRTSEAPGGGLGEVFEFEELMLGPPRLASGQRVDPQDEDSAQQHWGSVLKLRLKRSPSTSFTLHLPKVVRVPDPRKLKTGEPLLALAEPLEASSRLKTFVDAGLHLKPELLRSQDYPYPLAVGNFWRYRRTHTLDAPGSSPSSPPERGDQAGAWGGEGASGLGVSEALWEIVKIERYDSWRLVEVRQSYNDQDFTEITHHWLVTPKQIYPCSRECIRHVDTLDWLLPYMERTTPAFRFPMPASWRRVDLEVPKGEFVGLVEMPHQAGQAASDPLLTLESSVQYFSPGQGVVKRQLVGTSPLPGSLGPARVVATEELIESRIMP